MRDPTLARIAAERDCSATAVALAWAIRGGNIIAIPESGSKAHVKENAVALSLTLTPQELQTLDAAHRLQSQMFCGRCWIAASDGCGVSERPIRHLRPYSRR